MARNSMTTIAATSSAPAAMQATIGPAVQPAFGPSATPYISRPSPRLAVTNPGTSKRPAAGWAWSARKSDPKASANTPTGTFT